MLQPETLPGFLPNQAPFSPSSENNKPTSNKTTSQLELPVKYAVYTVISRYLIPVLPLDLLPNLVPPPAGQPALLRMSN